MNRNTTPIPLEFDIIRTNKGFTMKGWDFNSFEIEKALANSRMLNPAFEVGGNLCPWDCFFCFSKDPEAAKDRNRVQDNEMTLQERLHLISQAKLLGTKSINIVGAGEPTIDPCFWEVLEHISSLGILPIVYSEGSCRLTKLDFVQRLYNLGATVVLKVNSLWNEKYQNAIMLSGKRKCNMPKVNYFQKRNQALKVLMDVGFNSHDPTRLAFDTIVCKENIGEIIRLYCFARESNIFPMLVNYLPSGPCSQPVQNAISREEQFSLFKELARIDREEYGLAHQSIFPYGGGLPCSIRGLGLYINVKGDVWDCPGQSRLIGNIREEPLESLWEKAAPFRKRFDGRCEPREIFWKKLRGK